MFTLDIFSRIRISPSRAYGSIKKQSKQIKRASVSTHKRLRAARKAPVPENRIHYPRERCVSRSSPRGDFEQSRVNPKLQLRRSFYRRCGTKISVSFPIDRSRKPRARTREAGNSEIRVRRTGSRGFFPGDDKMTQSRRSDMHSGAPEASPSKERNTLISVGEPRGRRFARSSLYRLVAPYGRPKWLIR